MAHFERKSLTSNRFVSMLKHRISQSFTLAVCLAVALQPMMIELANAQDIIIDPNGNVGFKPSIQRNARPPVVNIAKPNAGGVSHNQYTKFDVSSKGAVLNNSTTTVNTTVAGSVAANPNLTDGTATTIVNEVNSTARSQILGTVEVAGDKANVIIANPAGILCSGCNFINAGEATLTTGTPVINGGNVRLDVSSGMVTIGRGGLIGDNVANVNLIGRTVVIDGKVTAIEGINVQGGAQSYDLTNKRRVGALAGVGAKPDLVIDGTEFGAIEAGRIQIIGNENGLGVRTLGAIQSNSGDVKVQNVGNVTVRSIAATTKAEVRATAGNLTIERDITSATANVVAYGKSGVSTGARAGLYGRTGVTVSGGTLRFEGVVQSTQNVTLTASQAMTFAAYGSSGAAFAISAATGLSITEATIVAQSLIADSGTGAFDLENSALFVGETITATAGDFHLGQDVVIQSLNADAVAAMTVNASGSFYNAADTRAFDAVTFTYAGNLYNAETGVITDDVINVSNTSEIRNAGVLLGGASLNLAIDALYNANTGLISADQMTIAVARVIENSGQIISSGNITLRADDTIRNQGLVQGIRLAVTAPNIVTLGGSETRGRDAVTLTATNGTINTNGIVSSEGTLTMTADAFTNAGWLVSSSTLGVNANTILNQGSVNSGTYIRFISDGLIRNEGDLVSYASMLLQSNLRVDNTANLIADSTLTVNGPSFRNLGTNSLVQARAASLQTASIENAGRVFMVNSFYRQGNIDRFVNNGIFASEGHIVLAGRDANAQFVLGANGSLLSGLSSTDRTADLITGRSINLNFDRMTLAGDMQAGGSITLKNAGTLAIGGEFSAGQNIVMTAANVSVASNAALRAGGYGYFITPGNVTNAGTLAFGDRIITRGGINNLTNSGVIYANYTSLEAMDGTFTNSGIFQTETGMSITAQNISNSGLLQAGTGLSLYARRNIGTNADGSINYRLGTLTSDGTLNATNTLTMVGGAVSTGANAYIAAGRMNVAADSFTNRANAVIDGTVTNYWTVKNDIANYGRLYSEASLVLRSTSATVDAASMLASGNTLSISTTGNSVINGTLAAKNITVNSADIALGTASSAVANVDLRLTATTGRVLALGELAAGDDLVISGVTFDLRGNAYGEKVTVSGETYGVTRGSLYSASFANIAVANGTFANTGTLEARTKLNIDAERISLGTDSRLAATDVELDANTWISNAGEILGAQSSLLTAGTSVTNTATGKITGVSSAVKAEDFTNYGAIDVYGFYGTVNDLTYNVGSIHTQVYTGIQSGRLNNHDGGSIISDDHLYLNTSGQTNNYEGARIRGVTVDMRGGQLYNYGDLRATDVLNVSDTTGAIYNTATGTIFGDEIYLSAGTWFNNSGRIGTSAGKIVSIDAGTSISNAGNIYARDINLESTTGLVNTGGIYASGIAQLSAGTNLVQQGVIRSENLRMLAVGTIFNDGDARATKEALLDAGSIQNRIIDGIRGYIRADKLVLLSGNGITNHGALVGVSELALQAETGGIYNSSTGTMSGANIAAIASNGWVTFDRSVAAGDVLALQGTGITLRSSASAVNTVSLKSTLYDVNAYSAITSKQVLVDATRNINANAAVFRGSDLTQLVANDIGRLTASQVSPREVDSVSSATTSSSSKAQNDGAAGRGLQYIASYPDLMAAYGWNSWYGEYHYNRWGASEGRKVTFDGLAYIASYPDLIKAYGQNAEYGAYHYIRWGRNEGRKISFDAEQYLRNYPDLRAAYGTDLAAATAHYIRYGYKEGRRSSPIAGAMSLASWTNYVASRNDPATTGGANWQTVQTTKVTTTTTNTSEFNTVDGKLEVIGGPLKDVYVELRTGNLGTQGTDLQTTVVTKTTTTQESMGNLAFLSAGLNAAANSKSVKTEILAGANTQWHTYERAAINASGNVSLITRAGDMLLTGSIKAAGDVYLFAGDRLGLRNINLNAADVLHLEGRGNVLRYGGVTLTPGNALEISTNANMLTSTWLKSPDLTYDVTLFANTLTVDRSYQNPAHTIKFLASNDLIQTNEVVTARGIDYQAGRDLKIDFNPFEWRAENPAALTGGTGWDTESLGRNGYTLVAGVGGLSLYAGRNVILTSGKLHSSRDLSITAVNSIISQPFYLENHLNDRPGAVGWAFSSAYKGSISGYDPNKSGLYELRAYENQIRAGRDISLIAGNSVSLIGTQIVSSNGDITIRALNGGVTMLAAPGQWIYEYESVRTWRSGWFGVVKNTEVTQYDALKDLYKPTTLTANNGDILVESTGTNGQYASILSAGTVFNAQNITLATPNGNITAGTYRQRNESKLQVNRSKKLFGFIGWGGSSSTSVNNSLINYGNNFAADDNLTLSAPTGTISITGGTLKARKINITAARLEINAAINTSRTEYNSRRDNMITITTITSGRIKETADIPQITSTLPISFNISGEVHIAAAAQGTDLNSQLINLIGTHQFDNATLNLADPATQGSAANQGSSVDQRYMFEYDLPGASDGAQFAYLDTLMTDYGATYHTFELRDQEWYDKQVQLNPAFKALLTAVVAYATGGLGIGASLSSNAIIAGGINAAANSLIVGVVEGTITGNFDMGDILRGALLAGVSSAIGGYLTENINLGGYTDLTPGVNTLDDLITPAAIIDRLGDRVITTVVSNVVYGQDPFAGFDNLGRTFLVSEVMAIAQFGIGELGTNADGTHNNNWEGSAAHLLLHGGVGCLAMAAMQGDCAAGFFSAAGQSLLAGADGLTDEQKLALAPLVGSLIGFVLSDGNATNVSFGGTIATSGIVNNYLTHQQIEDLQAELDANCSSGPNIMDCRDEIFDKYRALSQANRDAMEACTTYACWRFHADRMLAAQDARLELYESRYAENGIYDIFAAQTSDFVYEEQTQSGFSLLITPGALELMAAWGQANCGGVIDLSCRGAFVADANAQAGIELLKLGLDFIPVIGDAKGAIECGAELSIAACLGAVAGLIPLLGDGAKILIRRGGDEAVEVIADGAGGLRFLDDGIGANRPALTDDMHWVADADGNVGIVSSNGTHITDPDEIAAIVVGDVRYTDRGRIGNWNKELNNPRPNTTYILDNGDKYYTDANGRVNGVHAELSYDPNARNGYQQRVSGRECRAPDDCGGHLIGAVFGGAGEAINLVPMNSTLNGNGGAWYELEQRWLTALNNNQSVVVQITPNYGANTVRPTSFDVSYNIDGVQIPVETIHNTPTGLPE